MRRKLTDSLVKNAKHKADGKPLNYSDGGGMYLHVKPTGKYWRYNYRIDGKMKTLSMGVYPLVTLKQARQSHDAARELLAKGIDPLLTNALTNGLPYWMMVLKPWRVNGL